MPKKGRKKFYADQKRKRKEHMRQARLCADNVSELTITENETITIPGAPESEINKSTFSSIPRTTIEHSHYTVRTLGTPSQCSASYPAETVEPSVTEDNTIQCSASSHFTSEVSAQHFTSNAASQTSVKHTSIIPSAGPDLRCHQQVVPVHKSSPEYLLQLIGDENTEIPDDIISAAIELLSAHQQKHQNCYVGFYKPSQIHLFTSQHYSGEVLQIDTIPLDKNSVNIHPLTNHWVTSFYSVSDNQLYVYDSLMSDSHKQEACRQLNIIYGRDLALKMKYPYVTQQCAYPICGVMAIAFAFSCFLGNDPTLQQFNIHSARAHLKKCIVNGEVENFPVSNMPLCDNNNNDWFSSYMSDQTIKESQKQQCRLTSLQQSVQTIESKRKQNYRKRRLVEMSKEQLNSFRESEKKRIRILRDKNKEVSTTEQINSENEKERIKRNTSREKARVDPEKYEKLKQLDRNRRKTSREKVRMDPEEYEKLKQLNRNSQKTSREKVRMDPEEYQKLKQLDRNRRKTSREKVRVDPEEYEKLKQLNRNSQKTSREKVRMNPEEYQKLKQLDRNRQKTSREKVRVDPEEYQKLKQLDRNRRKTSREKVRVDPEEYEKLKQLDRNRQKTSREKVRVDPEEYEKLKQLNRNSQKTSREKVRVDPEEYEKLKQLNRNSQKTSREKVRVDPEEYEKLKQLDRNRQKTQREMTRQTDSERNEKQKEYDRARQQTRRINARKTGFSKKMKQKDRKRKTDERHNENIEIAIRRFKKDIKDYAKYICTCCNRLLYRRSVFRVKSSSFPEVPEKLRTQCLKGKTSALNLEWICGTCRSYLNKHNLPPQADSNNLKVPAAPSELKELTSLEVRLLCKRYPFMKLVALPKGRQSGLKGSVVNVPVNCEQVCASLPRTPSSAGIIPLKLKKRQHFKSHVMFQYIRPKKIVEALSWLKTHNIHYKNVPENSTWLEDARSQDEEMFTELIQDDTNQESGVQNEEDNSQHASEQLEDSPSVIDESDSSDGDSDDNELNDAVNRLRGVKYDTCVQPVNPTLDVDKSLSIAPGENQIPMNILMDKHFEEMAFPHLFPTGHFGFKDHRPVKISTKKYFQKRLLDSSCNFAKDIEYLFVAQTFIERQQILDSMSIALRKSYTAGEDEELTAAVVRDSAKVNKYILKNQAYRYLHPVRGSPPYWEKTQLKLLSAIKQFGIFTFFFTLSAADLKWHDTLQEILSQKGVDVSETQIDLMTWEEKCNILRSNPVTAARHFQFRLDMLMKDMILSDSKPLGHVRHFFYRIEFQQRGSPHAHGILWIDDAPDLEKNSPEEIAAFIDKYVQCRLPDEDSDEELYSLVNQLQRHSHSASCRKSGKECRFGFPRSISSHTLVSRPPSLDDTLPHLIPDQREWNCRIAGVVNQYLERADSLDEMSYEDVLQDCKLLPQVYQQALSKSASSPKVYLKRDPNAVNINNYNAYILRAWQANMDVQFVTDPYACIQYVVSYITKDEREMGTLLHAVAKESAQDTIKDQMKKCGQAFLNSRSVTAQEAAYRALGLPLHKSNFTSVWVPTGLPSERISLLKPTFVLQNLEEGDNDVFVSGISDKYSKRPADLENWCLAQFAAWYEVARKDYEPSDFQPDILADRFNDAEASPSSSVENAPKSIHVPLSSSHCVMRKRRKQAVVRFHKFSEEKQPRSYYHSQLFLFVPWRSESTDLLNGYEDYQDSYIEQKDIIDKNRSYLFKHESLVEAAFEQLQNEDQPREAWDQIAAENQQQEYDAEDEGAQSDQEHAILNPSDQPNIHVELPTPSDSCVQALAIDSMPPPLPYPDYCAHVRTLNSQQYEVLQVVLNWCITFIQSVGNKNVKKPDPLHLFVSGGAGTGKSHLISALYHTIELNLRKEGDTPDCPKVLLLAPTGTAAFNIQGATIHSALLFALKSQASNKQSTSSRPLSDDKKNTLRVKLSQLKFIIIDEISMVGSDFFVDIHNRLSEIFGGTGVFGGISIVAVGDMYQLPPVCQRYIFQPALNMFAALTLSLWGTNFTYMELTQIMRQADDQPFSEMLNRVRTGSHTPDDITLLKSRLITDDTCSNEVHLDKYLHVFATNAKVDAYNVQMLNQLSSEKIHLNATDRIPLSLKNYRLSDDEKHTGGLAKVITIAVGARVILTRNVDVSDGLTNGTQGIVREIKFLSINKPIAIMILFDSPSVGKNARLNSKVDLSAYKEPVVPISQTEATFSPTRSKATVIRKQFPVRLCWATSIHKVQGATLDNIVVSFENRFNSGQAYVALSRVKKLNQLHLISFDEKKIVTSSHVKKEMERMKKDTFHPNPFKSLSANANLTVALLNARSARNHFTDIMCHPVLKIADIVCLTEANVYHDQIRYYQREGWTLKCLEKSSVCNCHGILFYCSENIPVVSSTTSYQPHMEQLFVELSSKPGVGSIQVLYRSPSTAPATFITDLTSTVYDRQPDIILGDFNINVDSVWYRRLSEPLLNYRQCVTLPTHLSGSIIDLVYVKDELPQPKVTVYPTYFSDHSIVFLQF